MIRQLDLPSEVLSPRPIIWVYLILDFMGRHSKIQSHGGLSNPKVRIPSFTISGILPDLKLLITNSLCLSSIVESIYSQTILLSLIFFYISLA